MVRSSAFREHPASGRAAVDVEVVHAHHLSGRGPHSRVSATPGRVRDAGRGAGCLLRR